MTPPTTITNSDNDSETKALAEKIISLLTQSPTKAAFETSLKILISTQSSSEAALATSIRGRLEEILKNTDRSTWGEFLTDAYNSTVKLAEEEFTQLVSSAREHPLEIAATVLVSLLVFGVLGAVMPWVLRIIGFAERGIIADSLAAIWQRTYKGYVPAKSLFSYLQRLGMISVKGVGVITRAVVRAKL